MGMCLGLGVPEIAVEADKGGLGAVVSCDGESLQGRRGGRAELELPGELGPASRGGAAWED